MTARPRPRARLPPRAPPHPPLPASSRRVWRALRGGSYDASLCGARFVPRFAFLQDGFDQVGALSRQGGGELFVEFFGGRCLGGGDAHAAGEGDPVEVGTVD